MACRLSDFWIGDWRDLDIDGRKVEAAEAVTKSLRLNGYVFMVDGRFKGFVGSLDGVAYWVRRDRAALSQE